MSKKTNKIPKADKALFRAIVKLRFAGGKLTSYESAQVSLLMSNWIKRSFFDLNKDYPQKEMIDLVKSCTALDPQTKMNLIEIIATEPLKN